MTTTIYKDLTEEDIINLVNFAIENDIWGYWNDEEDPDFARSIERIDKTYLELREAGKIKE